MQKATGIMMRPKPENAEHIFHFSVDDHGNSDTPTSQEGSSTLAQDALSVQKRGSHQDKFLQNQVGEPTRLHRSRVAQDLFIEWPRSLEAALFDLDGTLVDSEHLTDLAIETLLKQQKCPPLPKTPPFWGRTWEHIANQLEKYLPQLSTGEIASQLQEIFHAALLETNPKPFTGALEAVRAVAMHAPVALVSSSNRHSVLHVVERLNLNPLLDVVIAAEDVVHSKPHPQPYLKAAQALCIDPKNGIVFEDSVAGLESARAAGMHTVAVGLQEPQTDAFDARLPSFVDLPPLKTPC